LAAFDGRFATELVFGDINRPGAADAAGAAAGAADAAGAGVAVAEVAGLAAHPVNESSSVTSRAGSHVLFTSSSDPADHGALREASGQVA